MGKDEVGRQTGWQAHQDGPATKTRGWDCGFHDGHRLRRAKERTTPSNGSGNPQRRRLPFHLGMYVCGMGWAWPGLAGSHPHPTQGQPVSQKDEGMAWSEWSCAAMRPSGDIRWPCPARPCNRVGEARDLRDGKVRAVSLFSRRRSRGQGCRA